MSPIGLLLSDDLIFTSRIVGTAQGLGLTVQSAKKAPELLELARRLRPACVIVDLANPGLAIAELVAELRRDAEPDLRVVAYGSHVDAAGLKQARDAGCDPVLPRSKFVQDLAATLPSWFAQ
jgi:CheY-like chemotaxis protein